MAATEGLPVLPLELRQLLPESITNSDIFSLSNLQLNGASLKSIPPSISILTTLDELHLVGNNLNKIPPEVGNLSRLSMLNLMDNHLLELPDTIGNLTSLKNLGLKSNLLTSLPGSISNLTNLIGIFLTNNKLTSLPSEIGYLTSLRKLQCANNALSQLPSSMSSLRSLELMRLAGNQIGNDQLHSIFRMPHLRWLTLSANPLSKHVPPDHLPPFISQAELDQLLNGDVKLGEGASGEVRKIRWQNRDGAVKLFKSTISPDGACEDEVKVSIRLQHPNLTRVLALVGESIEKCSGMLMELINGKPLADRPNMNSYLRSRYSPDLKMSVEKASKLLLGICSAVQYLHENGICHGDLYAHNILVAADGSSTAHLCDMGAAFPYDRKLFSSSFERLEISAYGLVLSEVARLLPLGEAHTASKWNSIAAKCMQSTPANRPTFAELFCELQDN